ncbi:MAG: lytic transglycosylase domain-containing protein [Parafilimonas sp.]
MKFLFKYFHLKKYLISFFAIWIMCFSNAYSNNLPVLKQLIKDSSINDSTPNTPISTIDSSKLFASLLSSSSNNNSLNFSMNAEEKFFADDYIKKNSDYLNNMKVWGKPYFNLYDRILTSYGIPVQLKYLSVIESSLNSMAVSWTGAVGPWQIMSDAAHENGLKTNYYSDDRVDYIKSTNAACQILKKLYANYGDWLLVVAAYNAGAGSVNKAIEKAHSKNFWDIQYYLPLETRNHVKKFIATHYFFEGDGSITTVTGNDAKNYVLAGDPKDNYLSIAANSTTINIYGKYNSVVIANTLTMDIALFNQLNPGIDNVLAKGEIYPMRIPADKVELFQSERTDILRQSVELMLSNASNISGK